MASVELASAYISLVPSAKGISSAIESEMGAPLTAAARKSGDDTGSAFSDGFKRHAKLVALAAVAGIATFAKISVDAASDMAESVGKTEVVFGDAADEVKEWGKTSAKAFGLSNQEALEAAGTYGNLFQAFGMGRKEATTMSKSLVEVAADLASFNNTSVDDALVALRSGLSGEAEPLKRFGVAITDARLKTEAMSLGLIKSTKEALTPAAKAQASYSLIMKDTALAQGDFARTSGGLANQQRILEAQTNNLKVAIGEKLLPAKLAVVKFLNEKGIPAFQAFGEKLADVYNAVKTLAESTIVKWVGNIKDGFGEARSAFEEYGKAGDWEAHGTFEKLGVAAAIALDSVKTKFGDAKGAFDEFNKTGEWEAHGTFEVLGVVAARVVGGVTQGFKDITQGVHAMGVAFIDGSDDITSSGLEGTLESVGVKARNLYDYLIKNKDTLVPIVAGLTGFAVALVAINKAAAGVSIVRTAFTALGPAVGSALAPLLANPIGLIIAGVIALGVAAYMLYTKFKPFRDVIDEIGRTIRDIAIPVWHALQDAFETVSRFITDTLIPTVTSIWDTIVEALTPLAKWIDENVISTFVAFGEAVGVFVQRMIDAWKFFWQFIEPLLKAIKDVVEITFGLIAGIFRAFIDVTLPILAAAWALVKAPVEITFNAIKAFIETILGVIRGVFQIFKGVLSGDFGKIWEGFLTLVQAPFNAAKDFIGETFNTIWELIKGMPSRIASIAKGMWDGIKEAFKTAINFIIKGWNSIEFKLPSFDVGPVHFGGQVIGLPDIPLLAMGGEVTAGQPVIVGDRGPELWVPRQSGTVIPNGEFGAAAAAAPSMTINISTMLGNPQEIMRVLQPALRTYQRSLS